MSPATAYTPDSRYAWFRLSISLVLAVVGGIGLWLAVVVIPTIQAEFGIDRAGASLPYTATFIGFAFGGYTMGRVADRYGVRVPISISGVCAGRGLHSGRAVAELLAVRGRAGRVHRLSRQRRPPSGRWWPIPRNGS